MKLSNTVKVCLLVSLGMILYPTLNLIGVVLATKVLSFMLGLGLV